MNCNCGFLSLIRVFQMSFREFRSWDAYSVVGDDDPLGCAPVLSWHVSHITDIRLRRGMQFFVSL